MSTSKKKYEIVFVNGRIAQAWQQLESEFPDRIADCIKFLQNNPENRMEAIGILKKLKGRHKGILQYDITKNDARVWYVVDKKNKVVSIRYAGHHPDKY